MMGATCHDEYRYLFVMHTGTKKEKENENENEKRHPSFFPPSLPSLETYLVVAVPVVGDLAVLDEHLREALDTLLFLKAHAAFSSSFFGSGSFLFLHAFLIFPVLASLHLSLRAPATRAI